ncbi:MAG: serine/threonine-protein phosphatase [Planctomycetaceae bacterium]|jgi:hypothetical protein|nr:serine/threonine-protein phosphatase [Planctomycetaceae bacterium]
MPDYIHIEVEQEQSSKKAGMPCGDVVQSRRTNWGTTVVCADGIGSGIRAHIAAEMCAARIFTAISEGRSFRKVFSSVAATMQQCRDPQKPFAAFSLARIRPDGNATILTYDAPLPILVSRTEATALATRPFPLPGGLAAESNIQLECGEGILLMSDGITQAGIGYAGNSEWTTEGVVRFVNECLASQTGYSAIPAKIHREAKMRWSGHFNHGKASEILRNAAHHFSPYVPDRVHQVQVPYSHKVAGDDCTVVLAYCRNGQTVNILTGPPRDRNTDTAVVKKFMDAHGLKIVCGGTTSKLVSKYLDVPLEMIQNSGSDIVPPRYDIKGISLVTEGAVTLNQVYNIIDEDLDKLDEDSCVTELRLLLNVADRVNFIVGLADNRANDDISFRQRGVLSRNVLIPLLVEKLSKEGKLVNVEYV